MSDKLLEIHKKYAKDEEQLKLIVEHCEIVATIAMWCASKTDKEVDLTTLKTACLLHDIASYGFMHSDFDRKYYAQHAILGSKIVLEEDFTQQVADIIETHVLLGLSKAEIVAFGFHLPHKDYTPRTIEAEILCYADRFHSKKPVINTYESFTKGLKKQGFNRQLELMDVMVAKYGLPDLEQLAKKFNHPIAT